MKALLLVAHGSRRAQSNEEVCKLAENLKKKCSDTYSIIHSGFLEIAQPSIPDGIKNCINDGAKVITILPYFLNSGRHVINDIPDIVNETKVLYPEVEMKIAPHLGASNLMMDLLISSANSIEN